MALQINNPSYGNVFIVADTFEELRSVSSTKLLDGYSAIVNGDLAPGDGLGGLLVWSTTSTLPDDGETVIAPADGQPGRWLKVAVGQRGDFTPEMEAALEQALAAADASQAASTTAITQINTAKTTAVAQINDAVVDANAQAALALERAEEALETVQTVADTGVGRVFATWAELAAITGAANDGAIVWSESDATHTDPITSATVTNSGVYQYVTGTPSGWKRIANTTVLDAAEAREAAEAAEESATAAVAQLSPFITPPASDSGLFRVLSVKFFPTVNGIAVAIPEQVCVREVASDSFQRGRFRVASYNGSSYTVFAVEDHVGSVNIPTTGYTGKRDIPLYSLGVSGLPDRTLIGFMRVDFRDGSAFGAYNTPIDYAEGGLSRDTLALDAIVVNAIDARAVDAVEARGTCFQSDVTDAYLRRLVRAIKIEGGDAGHDYYLNYETAYYSGIPLRRVRFVLHDATMGGQIVAQWIRVSDTDFTGDYSDTIFLANASAGTTFTDYLGITATMWIDWSAIDWSSNPITTYSGAAQSGVLRSNIITNEEMDDFLIAAKPKIRLTVGSGTPTSTHFNSVNDAIHSLYTPGLEITRSTFPCSDICTYSNQVLIEVVDDAYSEEIDAQTIGVIDQSTLLIPHYCTIRMRKDSVLHMAAPAENSAPVLEAPWSFRIEGGKLRQDRAIGYVIHVDSANGMSKPATVGPAVTRFHVRSVLSGVAVEAATGHNVWLWGCGIANHQKILIDGCTFVRSDASSSAGIGIHDSPNTTGKARVEVRNTRFICQTAMGLLKNNSHSVRHDVIVSNSEGGIIGSVNGVDSTPGYVRVGRIEGFTYDGSID